jgi:uncharacterized protein YbaR (Trm112 family)
VFIEVTDILRCPREHEEAYLVLVPHRMEGRRVLAGVLGCPVCQAEYSITDGVACLGPSGETAPGAGGVARRAGRTPAYDAGALLAFLGLEGKGGFVVLVGGAALLAAALAEAAPGVHVIAVNPPAGIAASDEVSVVLAAAGIPLKSRQVRGVVLGEDRAAPEDVAEALRVLLPGLRLVVEGEVSLPDTATVLARGGGVVVAGKVA